MTIASWLNQLSEFPSRLATNFASIWHQIQFREAHGYATIFAVNCLSTTDFR